MYVGDSHPQRGSLADLDTPAEPIVNGEMQAQQRPTALDLEAAHRIAAFGRHRNADARAAQRYAANSTYSTLLVAGGIGRPSWRRPSM